MGESVSLDLIAGGDRPVDVIFIHGLGGHPKETWTRKKEEGDAYWPEWIGEDIPEVNVYVLGYSTKRFWSERGWDLQLHEYASAILERIANKNLGSRPIAVIAHSLGGLIAKQIIHTGIDSDNLGWKNVAKNIKFVAFLATPHLGSSVATVLKYISEFSVVGGFIFSAIVRVLEKNHESLDGLNIYFKNFALKNEINITIYYETLPIGPVLIVDKDSADPGFSGSQSIPIAENHNNICKPSSINAPLYCSVKSRLEYFAKEYQKDEEGLSHKGDDSSVDPRVGEMEKIIENKEELTKLILEFDGINAANCKTDRDVATYIFEVNAKDFVLYIKNKCEDWDLDRWPSGFSKKDVSKLALCVVKNVFDLSLMKFLKKKNITTWPSDLAPINTEHMAEIAMASLDQRSVEAKITPDNEGRGRKYFCAKHSIPRPPIDGIEENGKGHDANEAAANNIIDDLIKYHLLANSNDFDIIIEELDKELYRLSNKNQTRYLVCSPFIKDEGIDMGKVVIKVKEKIKNIVSVNLVDGREVISNERGLPKAIEYFLELADEAK